jgi:lipopolysaccharide transport system ATP-binding protein
MAIIEVNHVTKEYQLGQFQSLKQRLQQALARVRGRHAPEHAPFKALSDVDFSVEEGEVLGIIGSNGAGKSTLLKLLARITTPTRGSVRVRGRVAPLIEVGAGLIGDLSGRENVYVNGAIMGMPQAQIRKKFDEIVAFAEIEEFIDTPIKRYSSGMSVRLGFSIATSVDADILIVDEVLAVGDLAFQRKCFDRMEDMIKRQRKTVVLVSHNIRQVQRLCSRAILLDHGKLIANGPTTTICNLFYEQSDEKIKSNLRRRADYLTSGEVDLIDVQLLDEAGEVTDRLAYKTDVIVEVSFKANVEVQSPTFCVGVQTTDCVYPMSTVTKDLFMNRTLKPGLHLLKCRISRLPLLPGVYSFNFGLYAGEFKTALFYGESVATFQVKPFVEMDPMVYGFFEADTAWELDNGSTQRAVRPMGTQKQAVIE